MQECSDRNGGGKVVKMAYTGWTPEGKKSGGCEQVMFVSAFC